MQSPRSFVALAALLLACAFLGCLPDIDLDDDPDYRDPTPRTVRLDVPWVGAPRGDWGWAAAASSALAYDGTAAEPCTVVGSLAGSDCCAGPPSGSCQVVPPDAVALASLLLALDLPALAVAGSLDFDEVRREIDAGNPVLVQYTGSIEGYFVVLFGYDPGLPDDPAVWVHDPFRGSVFAPFGERFGRAPDQARWAETVLVRTDPATRLGWNPLGEDEINWAPPGAPSSRR